MRKKWRRRRRKSLGRGERRPEVGKAIEPRRREGDREEEEERGRYKMRRQEIGGMRGRRRRNRKEKRNWRWNQRVEKREKVNLIVSALVPPLPLNAFSLQFCSVTLPYIFFFSSSPPLSSFPLFLFLISSSFSVSFSSHISPLSFRLLALFFLYIPFLALALSLVCFHASPLPLPLLSSLISFYSIVAFPSPRLPIFLRLLLILILCPIYLPLSR
jgi:hypothetical protein